MGGNGAGKSTFLGVLGGSVMPDSGEVRVLGPPSRRVGSVAGALHAGVRFVHRDMPLVPSWHVYEHFGKAVGYEAPWERVGLRLTGDELTGDLDARTKRLLAFARAVTGAPKAILADEPTLGLEPEDCDAVLNALARAAWRGSAVVIATHDVELAVKWADRIMLLRRGRIALDEQAAELRQDVLRAVLASQMIGPLQDRRPMEGGVPRLTFCSDQVAGPIVLRAGAITGLSGSLETGTPDFFRAAVGLAAGANVKVDRPGHKRPAYLSRERKSEWDLPTQSVRFNLTLAALPQRASLGLYTNRDEAELASALRGLSELDSNALLDLPSSLSIADRFKGVLARLSAANPDVLLLDEPFDGLDAGTWRRITNDLANLASRGMAIGIFSLDPRNLVPVCDRVAVVGRGGTVDYISRQPPDEPNLLRPSAEPDMAPPVVPDDELELVHLATAVAAE